MDESTNELDHNVQSLVKQASSQALESKLWLQLQNQVVSGYFYDLSMDFSNFVDVFPLGEFELDNVVKEHNELLRKQAKRWKLLTDKHYDVLRLDFYYFPNNIENNRILKCEALFLLAVVQFGMKDARSFILEIEILEEQVMNYHEDVQCIVSGINSIVVLTRYSGFLLFGFEDHEVELSTLRSKKPRKGFISNKIQEVYVKIPKNYCWSISLELMSDPVIVSTWQTYDRGRSFLAAKRILQEHIRHGTLLTLVFFNYLWLFLVIVLGVLVLLRLLALGSSSNSHVASDLLALESSAISQIASCLHQFVADLILFPPSVDVIEAFMLLHLMRLESSAISQIASCLHQFVADLILFPPFVDVIEAFMLLHFMRLESSAISRVASCLQLDWLLVVVYYAFFLCFCFEVFCGGCGDPDLCICFSFRVVSMEVDDLVGSGIKDYGVSRGLVMASMRYRLYGVYEELDKEAQAQMNKELSGWKLVVSDVFRAPTNSSLLCVMVGDGVQIIGMDVVTILFAAQGFIPQASRGTLLTCILCFYLILGIAADYVVVRLRRMIGRSDKTGWVSGSWRAACFFHGIAFLILTILGAIPSSIYVILILVWFCISVPITLVGGYFGAKVPRIEYPVRSYQIPRENPAQNYPSWLLVLGAGTFSFGTSFIKLFFIMSSIWMGRIYDVFGFHFVVLILLVVVCAEVSLVLTYMHLCVEDWKWWRKSLFASGSVAICIFLYLINCVKFDLKSLSGLVSATLYLGYFLCVVLDIMFSTGTVGHKWVFKIEYMFNGSTEGYNAVFVIKCYTQIEYVDYFETFSRADNLVALTVFLALIAKDGCQIFQLKVNDVVLRDSHEEVYFPEDYAPTKMSPIRNSALLSGFKQETRQRFIRLFNTLVQMVLR